METTEHDPSDTILLTGGVIRPFGNSGSDTTHEAIALREGRVLAVGTREEVAAAAGDNAREVDLDGAVVTPGLIDTHPHVLHFSVLQEGLVDILDATNHDDIVARIAARAAEVEPGEWIVTTPVGEPHYFIRRSYRDLAEGVLPDRHVLDRAAPDNPVWIQAWAPSTPNVTAFNSAGLAELGVEASAGPEVRKVAVERDADGQPTGRLFGSVNNYYNNDVWWDTFILRNAPRPSREAVLRAVRQGMREANGRGVTSIYEAHLMDFGTIDVYAELAAADQLTLRVSCVPDAETVRPPFAHPAEYDQTSTAEFPLSPPKLRERLDKAHSRTAEIGEMFRQGGVQLANDAPAEIGGQYMRTAYLGPYGEVLTGNKFSTDDRIRSIMTFCAERDMRLNAVVAGTRAHDDFLDLTEEVAQEHPEIRERSWLMQHAFSLDEGQVQRYADLNVSVTLTCSFTWGSGKVIGDRMGPAVLADLIPLRRLLYAGVTMGAGSDWGPPNPFEHIELAQSHRIAGTGTDGVEERNDGPAQVITRGEAYEMWTTRAAQTLQWDGIGALEPGCHADLIVLDRDPLTCSADDLIDTQVLATLVAGKVVHDVAELFA